MEGSKSFDFEISQINNKAIKNYELGLFQKAVEKSNKALNLSQQLRDPSQGILYFNLCLKIQETMKRPPNNFLLQKNLLEATQRF